MALEACIGNTLLLKEEITGPFLLRLWELHIEEQQ
jgi:hypothetical protein